jgi:arylsulfatase A-like enzyme
VIDILPTVVDLAGGKAAPLDPAAPPLPGHSLVPVFAKDGSVPHDVLYFKHEGNRALRMGNWKLVSAREDNDQWELFDLGKDRCEAVDLSAQRPELLREMIEKWRVLDEQYTRRARSAATAR